MKNLFSLLKTMNEKEFDSFMEITFTENERLMIKERWQIFHNLKQGLSQREVARVVSCSVVTVTRGAKTYRKYVNSITKFLHQLFNEKEHST